MSSQAYIFNPTERTSAAAGDGFSAPRLTTTDRNALSLGVNGKGMMVYDTTLTTLCIWNGTAWEFVTDNSNGFISVKDFGAKGDGVTDDTAAIQAAINSFGGNGIHLYIPSGTYKITSSLNVIGNVNTIFGDGATSVLYAVGAINVLVFGDGVTGLNFGTIRDFKIQSSDGLQTRGIWGRWLRHLHFVNIIIAGVDNVTRSFSTACFQADYSWSSNFTSISCYFFSGKGFWLGEDPTTPSNQYNDATLLGCQAFNGNGIGFHLKGSGISLFGCLAESCNGGGVKTSFTPGINISGGYFEANGSVSGFSISITDAQNAGGITNCFINNIGIAGSNCIVLNQVETFVVSGCNLRVNATGIGVKLETTVSNVYLISNKNEGSTGTLYGGVSYPLSAKISDTFTRFTDVYTTDLNTDSAARTIYLGRLSPTPGDNSIVKVRGRANITVFEVNTDSQAIICSIAGTGITLKSPNGLVTKIVTIDNAGNIALI